jgi:hypothetical protein
MLFLIILKPHFFDGNDLGKLGKHRSLAQSPEE